MNHEIKELFEQINDKKAIIQKCCDEFGGTPHSKRTNWFNRDYAVPHYYKPRVIEILKKAIKQQNKVKV